MASFMNGPLIVMLPRSCLGPIRTGVQEVLPSDVGSSRSGRPDELQPDLSQHLHVRRRSLHSVRICLELDQ